MTLAVSAFIIVALPILLYSFTMFDRIVRIEYEKNRAAWKKTPYGFFWKAPECTWFKSAWARNRLSLVWLFSTPEWMQDSADGRRYLRRFRICVLAWNVLILGTFSVLFQSLAETLLSLRPKSQLSSYCLQSN